MTPDTAQAARYRHRAIEVRMIADGTRDKGSKQILIGIAANYEQMAASWDAVAATEAACARLNLGSVSREGT